MAPLARAVAALLLLASSVSVLRAQEVDPAMGADRLAPQERPVQETGVGFEARQKFIGGSQHYRNTETFLDIELPKGFDATADFTAFKNDTSSWTPTITFGGGWADKTFSLAATYALSPLANDARSTAIDVAASARSDRPDFATTVAGDVLVTHNTVFLRFPVVTSQFDITQRTPTITLKQQICKTRLDVSVSEYTYNKDVVLVAAALAGKKLNRFSNLTGSLSGLIQGFPDHSEKFGLRQEVGPATLWASYGSIHFIDTAIQFHATSDTEQYGVDVDLPKSLSATLQYEHVRETGQAPSDQYGAALSWSL